MLVPSSEGILCIFLRGVSTYHYPLCPFVHELMSNSREMFNNWQAQRWWAENYENVMELYNVQKFNHQAVPLPSTTDEVRHPTDHLSRCFHDLKHAFLLTRCVMI
jgi:hypothetical protein